MKKRRESESEFEPLVSAINRAEERIDKTSVEERGTRRLWPAPYSELSSTAAFLWLTECWWTDNESDQRVELVPDKSFLRAFVDEWVGAYLRRQPLIVEKSRRMVISWACRGLETWLMGLQRGSWIIIDQTHSSAAEHLWRIDFALNQLYDRRPELGLAKHEARGAVAVKEPTHVVLANGSVITQGYQEAGSAQGKGKTGVTLEELSRYRSPRAFWSQALIVTQGSAKGTGGWLCAISNPWPSAEWQEVKCKASPRSILGLDRATLSSTTAPTKTRPLIGL